MSIFNVLGDSSLFRTAFQHGILNIGPNAEGQAPNTGAFQNRLQPSANAVWTLGKHTVSFGASYSYTQLNTIDKRTGTGTIATDDLSAVGAGLCHARQRRYRLLCHLVPAGQRQPLLPRQPAGQLCAGQVPGHAHTLASPPGVRYDWDGGLDREVRPHLQLRSALVLLDYDATARSDIHHQPASSSPATTPTAPRASATRR